MSIHYDGPLLPALLAAEPRAPGFHHSVELIAEDVRRLKAALGTPLLMRLSACPLPDVLSRLPEDARFGVVTGSRPELNMVIAWATDHAYVEAPMLESALARAGLGASHRFFIEAPEQIRMLADLRGKRVVQPATLVVSGTRPERGMDRARLEQAVAAAREAGIPVGGLACAERFALDGGARLRALADLAEALGLEGELTLVAGEVEGPLEGAEAYRAAAAALPARFRPLHLAGAAIFARAGLFATRVVSVFPTQAGAVARCDASLSQAFLLTEAAGALRLASPPRLLGSAARPAGACRLVGASGLAGEVFADLEFLPQPGDLLIFENCGADIRSFTPAAHGGLPEAPVFLLGALSQAEAAE